MTGWLKRREHDHAVAEWHEDEQSWEVEQRDLESLINTAETFHGVIRADDPRIGLELHKDERAFYVAEGASLIEPRRLPGHWQSGYSGFSFRIARGVRYHIGGSRGHYVQGDEVPAPVDTGTVTITNRRVVFQGAKQAREWAFTKLLGYQHDPALPWTAIQVSNRTKVSGVLYDREHADEFHFRLALALANYHDEVAGFAQQLRGEAEAHNEKRPAPPPPVV